MSGERILVIDDSADFRTLMSEDVLPAAGYQTLAAEDGTQGLALIIEEQPDLVLLDKNLPELSGLDILRELRARRMPVPVVFMTAHGTESIAVEAFRLGAKDYLAKPFDVEVGLATIAQVLSTIRLEREREALGRELEQTRADLEQRIKELTVLFGVSKSVTSLLDVGKVLDRVVEAATFITRAEEGALWFLEPKPDRLTLRADKGLADNRAELERLDVGNSTIGRALTGLEPISQSSQPGEHGSEIKPGHEVRALLAVPLVIKGQASGVLAVVNRHQDRSFSTNNMAMLQALADYSAIAIENARVYQDTDEALELRVEELGHLDQIARTVTSTLDQERIFDLLAARISEMFQVEAGSLLLLDEGAGELEFVTTWLSDHEPLRHIRLKLGQGIAGQVALLHEPLIVGDAYGDSRFYSHVDTSTGFLTRSLLCVPLMVKDRCIGVIELLNKTDGLFTQDDVERLSNVARPVAIALENARLYREAQTLHEAQSRFIAAIAEELRSPLTAIKGYSDMVLAMASDGSDSLWVDSVGSIQDRTEHLITLMEDLLDIARLETGETKLDLTLMPMRDIVTQVVSSFEQRLKEKNLRLAIKVSSRLPVVLVDQDRMNQVLGSLLMNAYLYTLPKGRITISAHVQQTSRAQSPEASSLLDGLLRKGEGPRWVAVSVEDTGIGILPEDRHRVFERFFRAEHPLVQFHSGRGLSLSIAKSLVELQGGHVWFESEAGQGSAFGFSVPVGDSQPFGEQAEVE